MSPPVSCQNHEDQSASSSGGDVTNSNSGGVGGGLDPRSGTFRVLHPYVPQHDGEIELNIGDTITNAKDLSNGWTVGRNVNNQAVGIFPSACVVSEALLVQDSKDSNPVQDDGLWYGLDTDTLDRLSSISTDDTLTDRSSQLFALADSLPPPPDLTDILQQEPIDSDAPNIYGLSNSNKNTLRKPHMLVKPNPSKNLFSGQPPASGTNHPPPPGDMSTPSGLHQLGSGGGDPATVWCHQGTVPHSVTAAPTPHRISSQESMLDQSGGAGSGGGGGRSSYVPPRSATPAPSRQNSQPNLLRSARPSIDGNIDNTERQNVANENLNNTGGHQPPPPPIGLTHQQIADIKRGRYYQDYRTLECPQHEEDQQDMDADIPAHHQHHPQHPYQYKPILKKKRRGGGNTQNGAPGSGYGGGDGGGGGGGGGRQEIYYADTEVYGSAPHLDDDRPRSLRLVVSVLCGLLSGFMLFLWMYHALRYTFLVALIAGTSLVALGSIAFAASRLCRCVGAVLLPSLCTTRGRIAFLVLIGGFLLDGPITNIYTNMEEVSRSMACSTEQAHNQSMLMLKPFDAMMENLNHTVRRLQQASADIGQSLRPLKDGLDLMEMDLHTGEQELSGTAKTCRRMVETAFNDCWTGIQEAKDQCFGVINALGDVYTNARVILDTINPDKWAGRHASLLHKRQVITANGNLEGMPENKDICEPLDVTNVCQSLNDSSMLCLPSGWAGDAIQDTVNATKDAIRRLHRTLHFDVTPDPYDRARVNASQFVYKIRKSVHAEFQSKTRYFSEVTDLLMKLIPVSVLLLLYASYDHVRRFVSRDGYDNAYITASFKRLDRKRSEVAGAESLLPLKKFERNQLIDATVSELSGPEDGLYNIGLAVYTLHLMLAVACYMFDYVLYWILAMVRAHGIPQVDVSGRDALELVVHGDGVIADLLQVFLKGFHPANMVTNTLETKYCLPDPIAPSLTILMVIFSLYFFLLLTILLKAYLLRARNRLTAYFYTERDKARVVHLYNVVLSQRRKMPRLLQQRARRAHRERTGREGISVCHKMSARVPPCRAFVYSRIRCLVCGIIEDQTFRDCATERCTGVYCGECYDDLERTCPLCHQSPEYGLAQDPCSVPANAMIGVDIEDYEQMDSDLQPYCRSSKIYV